MTRARAGAVTVLTSIMFFGERRRLVELAAKNRLPAVYPWREPVDAGGLMAYGPNIPDLFRRAAGYVDRILKGAKPADMPVEQPIKFELVINLKTARALDLTIAPSLLARADHGPCHPLMNDGKPGPPLASHSSKTNVSVGRLGSGRLGSGLTIQDFSPAASVASGYPPRPDVTL